MCKEETIKGAEEINKAIVKLDSAVGSASELKDQVFIFLQEMIQKLNGIAYGFQRG